MLRMSWRRLACSIVHGIFIEDVLGLMDQHEANIAWGGFLTLICGIKYPRSSFHTTLFTPSNNIYTAMALPAAIFPILRWAQWALIILLFFVSGTFSERFRTIHSLFC